MSHMTNPLATPDQLFQRRSFDALPIELQDAIFFATQCLTQAAGILLQLPQSVTAQANVLLARYWLVEPIMSHEFSDVSAATVYLTAKLSAHPRSPRDLANVYAYLLSPASSLFQPPTAPPPANEPASYYLSESAYHAFHARVLALEARALYALAFDTHVALPHPLAVTYLQALDFLGVAPRERIGRRAVAYLNAALLSPQMLYLTSQPNALAVAAVYNAARDVGAKMPECEWWEVFDVDREELGFLVVGMRSVDGWGRKMRADLARIMRGAERGMVTRRDVEDELRRRGIEVVVVRAPRRGGGGGAEADDAEEEAARRMDEKMADLEARGV
ncbi:cyclin-like protein [Thermothelomyces heterothallicus CBS 202.75]|uniref:cyclin-like protein n=1 Tax=Thermothelomyces heterothallicus CBS 202.75 TaxID=1149848 RepID=UPI003743AB82